LPSFRQSNAQLVLSGLAQAVVGLARWWGASLRMLWINARLTG